MAGQPPGVFLQTATEASGELGQQTPWRVCSQWTYPDHAIRMSRDDDVLCVPLVHLRHAATDNLLAPACERVHTHDGVPVDAPHMDVCASAGHDVPLRWGRETSLLAEDTLLSEATESLVRLLRTLLSALTSDWVIPEAAWNPELAD